MIFNMVGGGGGSSTKSTIIVSIETGSTVAAYSDSSYQTLVKTASEKSTGEYWLTGLNNGTYYIKATKGSDVSTISYTITEYGVYRITMTYTCVITLYSLLSTAETITYSSTGGDSGSVSVVKGTPATILANGNDTYTFSSGSTIWTSTVVTNSANINVNCWFGTALYWYGYLNTDVVATWSTRNGTATYRSNYIDFHATANNAQLYTNSPINITSFSTLSMYGRHDGQMQTQGANAFGIAESGTDTNFVASVTVDTTLKQYDVDISAQSGSYYIKHSLYSYNVFIYAMWLE